MYLRGLEEKTHKSEIPCYTQKQHSQGQLGSEKYKTLIFMGYKTRISECVYAQWDVCMHNLLYAYARWVKPIQNKSVAHFPGHKWIIKNPGEFMTTTQQ